MRFATQLAFLALWVFTGPAFARDWTDRQGREISADFVRVHQGQVVLKRGRQIMQVPYYLFSAADQEFVRNELKKRNQEYLLNGVPAEPPAINPNANIENPLNLENPPGAVPTDAITPPVNPPLGVVPPPILPGGNSPPSAPPVTNSPLFPNVGTPTPSAETPTSPNNVGTYDPSTGVVHSPPASPPTYRPVQPQPTNTAPHPSAVPPSTFAPPRTTYTPPQSTYTPPVTTEVPAEAMPAPSPSHYGGNAYSHMQKECGQCNRPVPGNLTAGDKCPHCGVYFEHDTTNGKTSTSAFSGKRIGYIISIAVFLLVGLARWLGS